MCSDLRVEQLVRADAGCCTYLLSADETGPVLVVDPPMDAERILEKVRSQSGRIEATIDTHIHADHLSGTREMRRLTGCPIYMYESSPASFDFNTLAERTYRLADLNVRIIHTPGHAPEHMCLLIEEKTLLTGDCLLVGDVGRVDLGRGSPEELYDSIFTKLLKLGDSVEILPGHVGRAHYVDGDTTSTIGIQRHTNPALQKTSKPAFQEYMTVDWPPKPGNYELYVKVNSGLLDLDEARELARASQGETWNE